MSTSSGSRKPKRSSTRRQRARPRRSRPKPRLRQLALNVESQPNDVTCGPTCLHALYNYYGDDISLEDVIAQVEPVEGGGTLAVNLARHAMERGYEAVMYTYNLNMFDPTWFREPESIATNIRRQQAVKSDSRIRAASECYLKYFELGGVLLFEELTAALLRRHLSKGEPILTGLSSTYLYECAREINDEYDDISGEPAGHFVVLGGYEPRRRQVSVADPLADNPRFSSKKYTVSMPRLISSILLGVLTYDANLLVLRPRKER